MNEYKHKERRSSINNRHASGISWRLFGALAIFVVVILAVVWIFQVLLLNRFYESTKMDEFKNISGALQECIEDDERLRQQVFTFSVDSDTCIIVFEVVNGVAEEIADSDVNAACTIHHIDPDGLARLYENARDNGGTATKRILSPSEKDSSINAVYVSVIRSAGNREYIIMLDSEFAPLNATVQALERQFGWITCILVMGALILALAMSRVICVPMEKMSKSARRLAEGDYSIEFDGRGYREAGELADALNYATEELAKNDNLQKELVANISHDLRTPLTMIKGYSEVMRDIPGENSPENVQVIIDETERLTELVNDMLDLSKIRSGTRKPEIETFDLTGDIIEVMRRYEKLTEHDEYKITFEYDENALVNADRTMILQVVYNLINNAINYTGDDKIVRIVQNVNNGVVRISVADTGVGIEQDAIPYIWDRYYKVDKVHKRAVVGTGLGLSIVKGILESHGARYGVNSTVGVGSTFWFELDVMASEFTDADFEE